MHLWFEDGPDLEHGGAVAATIRILDDGDTRAIGRVATAVGHRGRGLAARLIEEGIALCAGVPVTLGAQAYAAVPLFDARRQPMGILGIISREPIPDGGEMLTHLSVFGPRAAAEMERLRAERRLRQGGGQ